MVCETFIPRRFNAGSRKVIDQANAIIAEYQEQGFRLTLRQLFYQFVIRGLLPNSRVGYRQVCNVMAAGRDGGEIDWDAIEDRLRTLHEIPYDNSPADAVAFAARTYREDVWSTQPYRHGSKRSAQEVRMVKKKRKPVERRQYKKPAMPRHYKKRVITPNSLLCTREQVAEMLGGVSTMTVIRLEERGSLTPVRLTPNGMVFYAKSQVEQIAQGGGR
jgi:hypothetical protein